MSVADLFVPERISLLLAAATLVGLGAWLFFLDVSNRAQRVFALLLLLRGLTFLVGPLRSAADTARDSVLWATLAPYTIIPVVPIVIYFLSVYPRRRGLARFRAGPFALFALTLALLAWYVADHASYATITPTVPAGYAEYGPLFVLQALRLPALAMAGLVLAQEYRKNPKGSLGFSLFLMVAGFTLNALFDGTLAAFDLVKALQDPGTPWFPWDWARWWLPVVALPIGVATCGSLVPVLGRARKDPELQEVTRFFFAAVPLALASPFITLLPYAQAPEHTTFVMGVWRLLVPLLLAYALMRYQLFGIDLRLKAGVRRAILVGVFVGVFFLITEAAEALVSEDRAPLFGIAAAGLLAVMGKPIQTFAERAANGVMPDTQPVERLGSQARFRMYLHQFELVQQDGAVSPKERRMLGQLATLLDLRPGEAEAIEAGAMPARDDPAPPRDKAPASHKVRRSVVVLGSALVIGAGAAVLEARANASSFGTGLVTAAIVALLLGPLESLSQRMTRRPLDPAKREAMRAALADAWADGELSERDVAFLAALQKRLRVSKGDRRRIEAEVRGQPARRMRRRPGRPLPSGASSSR